MNVNRIFFNSCLIALVLFCLTSQAIAENGKVLTVPADTRDYWKVSKGLYSFPVAQVYQKIKISGETWYPTRSGLIVVNDKDELIRWISHIHGLSAENVPRIYFDGEKYWLPSRRGISVYYHEQNRVKRIAPDIINEYFGDPVNLSFYGDSVLVRLGHSLFRVNRTNFRTQKTNKAEVARYTRNTEKYPSKFIRQPYSSDAKLNHRYNIDTKESYAKVYDSWNLPQYGNLLSAVDKNGMLWSMKSKTLEKFDIRNWKKTSFKVPRDINTQRRFSRGKIILFKEVVIAESVVFNKSSNIWKQLDFGSDGLIGILHEKDKVLFLIGYIDEMDGTISYKKVIELETNRMITKHVSLTRNEEFSSLYPSAKILGGLSYVPVEGLADYKSFKKDIPFPAKFEKLKKIIAIEYQANSALYLGGGNGVHWFGSNQRYRLTCLVE